MLQLWNNAVSFKSFYYQAIKKKKKKNTKKKNKKKKNTFTQFAGNKTSSDA